MVEKSAGGAAAERHPAFQLFFGVLVGVLGGLEFRAWVLGCVQDYGVLGLLGCIQAHGLVSVDSNTKACMQDLAGMDWVAVKELKLSFYSKETPLCTLYPYYSRLN